MNNIFSHIKVLLRKPAEARWNPFLQFDSIYIESINRAKVDFNS